MSAKDAITLKVLLQANGSVKAMRFGLDMTVRPGTLFARFAPFLAIFNE